jgi:predicted phage terminase large subunit-like protein
LAGLHRRRERDDGPRQEPTEEVGADRLYPFPGSLAEAAPPGSEEDAKRQQAEDPQLSADKQELLRATKRLIAVREAHDDLLKFAQLAMPDPNDMDNPDKSLYQVTPQARLLCEILHKIDRREILAKSGARNFALSIAPQTGKSQLISRVFPAWQVGRNPRINMIIASYNQDSANGFGDDVRAIVNSHMFRQVFPECELRDGGKAKDLLITTVGGKSVFAGVGGGAAMGKPADIFVVDDPIKSDEEAQSDTYRQRLWHWFARTASTRTHNDSAVVVVHTRWSGDDLIGRLCDPEHPDRDKEYAGIAGDWLYLNVPAVISDPDLAKALGLTLEKPKSDLVREQFGDKPISALWEQRHSLERLARQKRLDKRGFSSLYMGKPSPEDGDYFRASDLVEYDRDELPKNLRIYGASDHAVSTKAERDFTVLGCVGIDENDDIWVLPTVVWDRFATDRAVDELLIQFKNHKPMLWWMESENISKSFGPFLLKRMREERVYTAIDHITPSKDKALRARAIQGRMRMGKVRFPRFAPWWQQARGEMLRFPTGAHDDFVDWLAYIGLGLMKEVAAPAERHETPGPPIGSIEWILRSSEKRARSEKRVAGLAGW